MHSICTCRWHQGSAPARTRSCPLPSGLGYGSYSVTAVVTLLATFNEAETMLCVGHEPDLRELSSAFLGLKSGMGIKFPKSGLMRIDFRAFAKVGAGHLHFFYRPHDLLALA